MNQWLFAAIVLTLCLIPCAGVCFFAGPLAGLAALEVAGALTTAVLMLLAESLRRQPFIDLAVVFGALSLIGAIVFARLLEHDL
jgi:multisubunit Na+/H+ antiporter MnhF subunit